MPSSHATQDANGQTVLGLLAPLMFVVLMAFLIIGIAIPVLPFRVRDDLHLGTFTVGMVTGAQFVAALFSRLWAGRFADGRGAKCAVLIGIITAVTSGGFYLLSMFFTDSPVRSVSILLIGRVVLGAAESLILTGAVLWRLMIVGAENAGSVIAWMGTAMFAALATGAPIGTVIYHAWGFGAVAIATGLVPLLVLVPVLRMAGIAPPHNGGAPFLPLFRRIWLPGLGAALASVGFGVLATFSSLLFAENGWHPVWQPFTAYAVGLIISRLVFGSLPDRIGGARSALFSIVGEVLGLLLIFFAPSAAIATIGAALTGVGYALVFPGFGVEVVRRVSPQNRGTAMGLYTACPDLALGLSGPLLGLVAGYDGLSSIFLCSAGIVSMAVLVSMLLMRVGIARPV